MRRSGRLYLDGNKIVDVGRRWAARVAIMAIWSRRAYAVKIERGTSRDDVAFRLGQADPGGQGTRAGGGEEADAVVAGLSASTPELKREEMTSTCPVSRSESHQSRYSRARRRPLKADARQQRSR